MSVKGVQYHDIRKIGLIIIVRASKEMHIKITNSKQFKSLLEALAGELVEANIHYKLHKNLIESVPDFSTELNQSPAFWSLTVKSHLDVSLYRLCKVYDQHSKSLNLKNLLDTIKKNIGLFDVENFRERLKKNPFVESLSEDFRKPSKKQLEKDLAFVSSKENPLVDTLINKWRNNLLAHIGARPIVNEQNIPDQYPLKTEDIEILLKTGMSILNKYSSLFVANTYSSQIVGHDDYKFVLKSIRENLNLIEQRFEQETRKFLPKEH